MRRTAAVTGSIFVTALAVASPALAKTTAHRTTGHQTTAHKAQAATPKTTNTQTANADFTAGIFSAQFSAVRPAGAPETAATGNFSAVLRLGQNGTDLIKLAGPVTCLDVSGAHVGLFYPVTSSSPSAISQVMKGVYVYAQLGANGKPLVMNFLPSTSSTATSCDPLPGLIPITQGYLSLTQ